MIYFDSAATSLQKPHAVSEATFLAIRTMASPGRGGHAPSMHAAETVFNCRSAVDSFFNTGNPERVVFTFNATHALNIAISSLISRGDAVVISGYEHNAVLRPLTALGASIRVAESPLFNPEAALEAFRRELPGAACAVCTHVSNVFGYILPIAEIAALCTSFGVPLIIDASQSAGVLPLDFTALGAEFIAAPGHKGLLGPQGTGILLCRSTGKPILFGGTGGASLSAQMPDFLPDRHEAGTHNVAGIAGLEQGIAFLRNLPENAVASHEKNLARIFAEAVSDLSNTHTFLSDNPALQTGVVSVISKELPCEEIAERLAIKGVCVRAGLHCAPLAHKSAGTLETGTVRFSFSPYNSEREIVKSAQILKKILRDA